MVNRLILYPPARIRKPTLATATMNRNPSIERKGIIPHVSPPRGKPEPGASDAPHRGRHFRPRPPYPGLGRSDRLQGRALERVLVGRGTPPDLWTLASLPDALPEGSYRLDPEPREAEASQWALGWALGAYGFTRYKPRARKPAHLLWPTSADRSWVERLARSITLARDLINTPAEHMGPADLAQAAQALASRHGARVRVVVGDELLSQNYPSIHAVGRASVNAPRLIDIRWGEAPAPLIALIGKGVCFDSGGLDLKTAAGMKMMKKDMGGAATILGLAEAIMAAGLPVRLRVLVPAVENAVAGNAFRPLDVIATRKGLHVEIGNTDAEGRLILADALT